MPLRHSGLRWLATAPPRSGAFSRGDYVNLCCALVVGAGLRVACLLLVDVRPSWDGVIYERAAEQLARGEGYTQRIFDEGASPVPTAFFPPGYPAMLALFRQLTGSSMLDGWLQVFAGLAVVPGAWLIGRRLGGPPAGMVAAWLVALWPGGILLSASLLTEPVFSALLMVAVVPVLYASRAKRFRMLVAGALVLGAAAYVRATALAVAPLLAVASAWSVHRQLGSGAVLRKSLAWAAIAMAVACIPLAPWIARNHIKLGAPVLVSTNGGFNLLLGTLGEGSYERIHDAVDCPDGMREVDADRCRTHKALARIREDPLAWAARGVLKVVHTMGHESAPAQILGEHVHPDDHRGQRLVLLGLAACRGYWLPFVSFALLGVLLALRDERHRLAAVLVVAPVAAVLLLHFIYIGGDRYHAPLVPFLAGFAGLAWTRMPPARALTGARSDRVVASITAAQSRSMGA